MSQRKQGRWWEFQHLTVSKRIGARSKKNRNLWSWLPNTFHIWPSYSQSMTWYLIQKPQNGPTLFSPSVPLVASLESRLQYFPHVHSLQTLTLSSCCLASFYFEESSTVYYVQSYFSKKTKGSSMLDLSVPTQILHMLIIQSIKTFLHNFAW